MARIVLGDSCPLICAGLKQILRRIPGCKLVRQATDPSEIMKTLRAAVFDLLILDVNMSAEADGLALLGRILQDFPKTSVLIYTAQDEASVALRALHAGAAGYLTKDSPKKELAAAIRTVLSGGRYVAARLERELAWRQIAKKQAESPLETLSPRERQVFDALASGKRAKEIAGELSLDPKTISGYRHRLLQKLGLTSNADLIRLSLMSG